MSCQDHIFALKQILEKICVQDQKIYMSFVRCTKTFDSVPRKHIWQSLRKRGTKKKLRNDIKTIYEVTRSYVKREGNNLKNLQQRKGYLKEGF